MLVSEVTVGAHVCVQIVPTLHRRGGIPMYGTPLSMLRLRLLYPISCILSTAEKWQLVAISVERYVWTFGHGTGLLLQCRYIALKRPFETLMQRSSSVLLVSAAILLLAFANHVLFMVTSDIEMCHLDSVDNQSTAIFYQMRPVKLFSTDRDNVLFDVIANYIPTFIFV
jgi:hypothetical protein